MTPSLDAIRQAAAEILAYTIRDIVPNVLMVKGERTDIGFYYDFVMDQNLDEEAIPMIEERMRINIKKGLSLKSVEMMRENAAALFEYHGQAFQADIALQAEHNVLPILQIDTFYDYCHPPYVPLSSDISAFKILSITKEKVGELHVTRITGTAFNDRETLKKFIKKLEEAKKIDHRLLGKEKDLFLLDKAPVWLPKGMKIRETLTHWWKNEHLTQGYSLVKAASHRDVFKHFKPSNREFPLRFAEISEKSHTREHGIQNSLLNSPAYTHDTATTFCLREQVSEELNKSLQFIRKTSNILGFGNQWYLVTQSNRDKAIEPLTEGLKQSGISFTTEAHKAFGNKSPRIEVRWADFLDREWVGPTLSLEYHGDVATITRSVFSSLERCIALLVEHYAMTKENVAESFEQH